MIFNVFFEALKSVLMTVFGVLPDIPDLPSGITNVLDTGLDFISNGFTFLVYIFGGAYLLVVIPLLIVLINFKWIYHLTMWIVRKLPIGAQ